ncbi:MAG: D-alanyl-D-alanine carboxypeptidase family protein [Nitrosomonas sp.]
MIKQVQVGTFNFSHNVNLLIIALLLMFLFVSGKAAYANPLHASIVIDADTKQVLHELHADAARYPASLTKMMTLYMLFEALEQRKLSLNSRMYVSHHAASMPPTNINLREGDSLSVHEAIQALVVRSANNVAAVVAETLGGSETNFSEMMTAKAYRIGMMGTNFRNASGLPHFQQITTARDMAKLSARLMSDFPRYYHYFSTPSFNFKGTTYNSHNRMVRNVHGVDGLKTGFIRASGFNIATSAKRNNHRVIVVVMGGQTASLRDQQVSQLLEYSFNGGNFAQFVTNDAIARSMAVAAQPVSANYSDTKKKIPTILSQSDSNKKIKPIRAEKFIESQKVIQAKTTTNKPAEKLKVLKNDKNRRWEVQIGSYAQQQKAQAQAKAAKRWVSGSVVISEIAVSNRKVYRARLVGLQENQAREGCQSLSRQGIECLVVRPHG